MYITLICFLITSLIFVVLGKSSIIFLDKANPKNYSVFDSFFVGLCVTGAFLNIWSLFLPTDVFALLVLFLLALVLIYKNISHYKEVSRQVVQNIKKQKTTTVLLVATVFIVLLYSIVLPRLYDSYLYHINAIQWNEYYRVVPGLANFHDRFGLNSSLFVLSAGFSFSAIYNQQLFIINSLCFLVFFLWILKQALRYKGAFAIFALVFMYFFIQQYALDLSSPGSDLLPNILVGFVLLSIVFEKSSIIAKPLIFIFIPLFCITLKLSTLPIVLITLVSIYLKNNRQLVHSLKQLILYGIFLIVPWLIRNVVLSGYLLFPVAGLDFFSFDWEVPAAKVIDIKKWIYSWARIPFKDCNLVLQMPLSEWGPVWWKNLILKNQRFFILAAVAPITFGIYWILNRKERIFPILMAFGISYLSFVLWFFVAPDYRFSFAVILILALSPILLLKNMLHKFSRVVTPAVYIVAVYVLYLIGNDGYRLFREDYNLKQVSEYAYLPRDVSEVKDRKEIKYKNVIFRTKLGKEIELYTPNQTHSQCYDKFPCTWFIENNFRLRGEDLQDGFVNM